MLQRIVVIKPKIRLKNYSQVNILWFPTTNLFVALATNILADQNVMSCVGGDLTFHCCHKTLTQPLTRDFNLNKIINICRDT